MRRLFYRKNSILLISALLLVACQPPSDNSQSAIAKTKSADEKADADLSFVIEGDTITLTSDSILNIKSSRYQPSLGLKGQIKPLQQSRFVSAKDVTVEKVLVQQGQWVEKGTPLFILQHQPSSADKAPSDKQTKAIANQQAAELKTTNSLSTVDQSNTKTNNEYKSVESPKAQLSTTDAKPVKTDNDKVSGNANTNAEASTEVKQNSLNSNEANKTNLAKDTAPSTRLEPTTQAPTSQAKMATVIVRASFSGRVKQLAISDGERVRADNLLLSLADDSHLKFVATLPIEAEPQLSVGQSVNFTTENSDHKYTGQVSKLSAASNPNELQVHVQVLKNEVSRENQLQPNLMVTGRVDYGQIAVGTVVPKNAIHDADLTVLQNPPYQPLAPLSANVWIIKQDQRLTRQPVEVIEYDPITEQYLIAGINNDSLICLADLPIESAGKKVVIS